MESQENQSLRKLNEDQLSTFISQWHNSGMSKQAFCREHQIPYHAFLYRMQKSESKKVTGFIPIKVTYEQLKQLDILKPQTSQGVAKLVWRFAF